MKIITVIVLIIIAIYTAGFAVTLWKEKQKFGAAAVFILTIAILILPFFSILK
ncbi:hypothetical protein J1P26_16860 [Neobacillus sp. MM2021_6]|uniref:hypothetical protein n=1 Tax=Bacillaceae TaxID=186817 RepID=UPI00140B6EB5|nr:MULTISPECIES: hypothetical protein [Bacillaceae]MBO0961378.1 hypothetical protein [Neobacillus sp. MM2021_6]NHC20547.1 hypothetical protein [Bacillus sp. MM2020_4]